LSKFPFWASKFLSISQFLRFGPNTLHIKEKFHQITQLNTSLCNLIMINIYKIPIYFLLFWPKAEKLAVGVKITCEDHINRSESESIT